MMKAWARLLGGGLGLGGGMLAYAWMGERPRMRLQVYRVPVRSSRAAGLRLLHLSDQHLGGDSWVQKQRLRRLQVLLPRLQVDAVMLTGDFLHDQEGLRALETLLQMLPPAPLGTYAVLGNHDYAQYSYGELFRSAWANIQHSRESQQRLSVTGQEVRRLRRLAWQIYSNERLRFAAVPNPTAELQALLALYDVQVLLNTAVPLGDRGIWVAGVDDWVEGRPDVAQALAAVPADATLWLLSHHPDVAYHVHDRRLELVLAGHTHGGQVVLPLMGAVHTQGTLLPRQHPAGIFDDLPSGARMVVSRGMGESTPLRFRCLPEVVVVDLVPES
ncbi:MAG: hypothetical protein GXP37_10235 [Chloroflexi bacterium]|nr:hypothetical protein [Chloroflexota bacterium]